MATKKSRGRQKIDIVKIPNGQNLQVTFSKRRSGLFKKTSELCTLTGSEIALVAFSPGEKAYAFGTPSVNDIIERFEFGTPHPKSMDLSNVLSEANRRANVQHLNTEVTTLENRLECERKKGKTLDSWRKISQSGNWWEGPIHEFNLEQLEHVQLALLELQKCVRAEVNKEMSKNSTKSPLHQGIPPYGIGLFGLNNIRENEPGVYELFQPKSTRIMTFPSYVGPSGVATISIENGTPNSMRKNIPTTSVPCNANGPRFHAGSAMPPNPQGFIHGYGSGGLL